MIQRSPATVSHRLVALAFPLLLLCFWGLREVRKERKAPDEFAELDVTEDVRGELPSSRIRKEPPGRAFFPLAGARGQSVVGSKIKPLVSAEDFLHSLGPDLLARLGSEENREIRTYLEYAMSSSDRNQPWLCWDERVPAAKLAAYHELEKFLGLGSVGYRVSANQFQNNGRWSKTATDEFEFGGQGDASIVTWSIVPDGTSTPGLINQSGTGSNLRAWMASIYGGSVTGPAADQPWFQIFEDAFAEMAATCGVTLVYEAMDDGVDVDSSNEGELGTRGDIRLAARQLDGNSGNLAIAFPPDHGDIVFDSSDGTFSITSGNSIRLFNTVTHELGHSLGLAHVCPINQTKLLEPSLTSVFRGPQFDEFQSLQRLYGDRFEVHDGFRDNDTAESAKVINLVEGLTSSFDRLSIDDDRDRDFYRFEGMVGQRLNVEVIPGEGIYLEGGETNNGCTQGTGFNSATIHDLSIQVLDADGETIIFEASSGAAGDPEVIELFELPKTGPFFLRIDGDRANATQIYELRAELQSRLPAPRLRVVGHLILEESGSIKNGRLDPGETVRLAIEIENEGELPTGTLSTNLSSSSNSMIFSKSAPTQLDSGESGVIELVVGTTGECGDFMMIDFTLGDASGELLDEILSFEAGVVTRPIAFEDDFEGFSDLPADWSSDSLGSGEDWTVAPSHHDSRFSSAFTPSRDSTSEAFLFSPPFELAAGGGTLGFGHVYRLEPGFDGALLELSRNGGEWTDLITDPGVVVTGGYNRTIREGFGSAIAGQQAWSGILAVPSPVSVELPKAWAGDLIQFRWRVVHDSSSARDGWWIDDVKMEMLVEECEVHRPEIFIELLSGSLAETYPSVPAVVSLGTNLPLVLPLTIPLEFSGAAILGEDYGIDSQVVLPAGVTSVEVPVSVISDLILEEDESAVIGIPIGHEEFAAGSASSVQLTIFDLLNIETWSARFFGGPVDLTGDSDGDGFDELAEYVLGTDPGSATDRPVLLLLPNENQFLLPLHAIPTRPDASLGIEFSNDLKDWQAGELVKVPEGLQIAPVSGKSYFRLTFSLD